MARAYRRSIAELDRMIDGGPGFPSITTSYIEAIGDLTLEERQAIRRKVNRVLLDSALDLAMKTDYRDLVIRDTLPNTDLGVTLGGPAVGAGTSEDWLCQVAGVNGTDLQYWTSQLGVNTHICFYGISYENVPFSISRVRLQYGAGGVTTRFIGHLEKLFSRLEPVGYFSDPVLFTKQEVIRCMVMPRAAFAINTQRLAFLARTIEPIEVVISRPAV